MTGIGVGIGLPFARRRPAQQQAPNYAFTWQEIIESPVGDPRYAFVGSSSNFHYNGKLYFPLAYNGGSGGRTIGVFDLATNAWSKSAPIPETAEIYGRSSVRIGSDIYVQYTTNGAPRFRSYSILSDTWSADYGTPAVGAVLAESDDSSYIFGMQLYTGSVYIFDVTSKTWLPNSVSPYTGNSIPPFPEPNSICTYVVVRNGRIFRGYRGTSWVYDMVNDVGWYAVSAPGGDASNTITSIKVGGLLYFFDKSVGLPGNVYGKSAVFDLDAEAIVSVDETPEVPNSITMALCGYDGTNMYVICGYRNIFPTGPVQDVVKGVPA